MMGDLVCRYPSGLPEAEQRALVVKEVRSWIATRYHHNAAVKRNGDDPGGVDCGRIIIETFADAGLTPHFDPGYYPSDWHLHRNEERYMEALAAYLPRVDAEERPLIERDPGFAPGAGDVLMWRVGRTYSHAAIVTAWPLIVHASAPDDCVVEVALPGTPLEIRPMRVFSYWSR